MILEYPQHYELATQDGSPFDYDTYLRACQEQDITPLPITVYFSTMGVSVGATERFPDLSPTEAYKALFIEIHQNQTHIINAVSNLKEQQHSQGVGDTLAKITHATGIDKVAEFYTKVTGKDCGCRARQDKLNQLFPYKGALAACSRAHGGL